MWYVLHLVVWHAVGRVVAVVVVVVRARQRQAG